MRKIAIAGPSITEKEIDYVTDAITNGWYEHANDYINRFEDAFKAYLGRKYAISLPSCTSGLHLSLLALGVGPGDEVIVPDATWIASAAPITYVGATPIFADIEPNTWCISAKTIKPLINSKTKAIIAVNLYGHMPSYDDLIQLGIPIIEDAAESIGSKYNNKLSGTFGVTSCFSFHGSKTLTTGEGGMLVTDDDEIYKKCMILRDHGRLPGDIMFRNIQVGYKYKMSALQAALGLAQLERIEELVDHKRKIYSLYKDNLANISSISLNPYEDNTFNSYWMITITLDKALKITKEQFIEHLQLHEIPSRPFFYPLSSLEAYKHLSNSYKLQNLNSYEISSYSVNLPSSYRLTISDVEYICGVIKELIGN